MSKWIRKSKEDHTQDIEDITSLLEDAIENIGEAADNLEQAKRMMRDLPYDYNITGNMDAYVINYLQAGHNSISDKIEKYIEETAELDFSEEEEEEESEELKRKPRGYEEAEEEKPEESKEEEKEKK